MAGSASLTPYQNLLGTAGVAAAQRLTGDSGNDVAPTSDILVSADKFGGHPEMVSQVYVEQASVNGGPIKTHYHPANETELTNFSGLFKNRSALIALAFLPLIPLPLPSLAINSSSIKLISS
jgi:hypothetical protein